MFHRAFFCLPRLLLPFPLVRPFIYNLLEFVLTILTISISGIFSFLFPKLLRALCTIALLALSIAPISGVDDLFPMLPVP